MKEREMGNEGKEKEKIAERSMEKKNRLIKQEEKKRTK
jgi:hypothetical protein